MQKGQKELVRFTLGGCPSFGTGTSHSELKGLANKSPEQYKETDSDIQVNTYKASSPRENNKRLHNEERREEADSSKPSAATPRLSTQQLWTFNFQPFINPAASQLKHKNIPTPTQSKMPGCFVQTVLKGSSNFTSQSKKQKQFSQVGGLTSQLGSPRELSATDPFINKLKPAKYKRHLEEIAINTHFFPAPPVKPTPKREKSDALKSTKKFFCITSKPSVAPQLAGWTTPGANSDSLSLAKKETRVSSNTGMYPPSFNDPITPATNSSMAKLSSTFNSHIKSTKSKTLRQFDLDKLSSSKNKTYVDK